MASFIIEGGKRLSGSIRVQGSKNSVLPILAAAFLANGISVIHNCPALSDVESTVRILKTLGCSVKVEGDTITVDSRDADGSEIPEELMRELRSSVIFLGAILGRMKIATVSAPGGCDIGLRPIDLHLSAMKKLGVSINEDHGKLRCTVDGTLRGAAINLTFPSVGATENAILASATASGTTTILNAAREPEISDLCDFLNGCGAKIHGGGDSTVTVEGVQKLWGTEHTVICDRIAAATYLCAAALTRGDVEVTNTVPAHLGAVLPLLEETGCDITTRCSDIRLRAPARLLAIDKIVTQPYPGFPTDAQAPFTALTSVADGTSVIVENIFESRFKHVPELIRMGAKIRAEGRVAVIEGAPMLYGANVVSPDLRGGSALVLAGLAAHGKTVVSDIFHIDRGYERFEDHLRHLGAEIRREADIVEQTDVGQLLKKTDSD